MKYTLKFQVLAIIFLTIISCQKPTQEENGRLVPLTVMDDPTLPSISINGNLLHSETYGNPNDPMIVAIHGGPGADYRGILNFKDLANDGMYVVFYDQRGSGLSERLDANSYQSVQEYIDELEAVIQYYKTSNTQKVILAGHSWGAMLATAYVDQNPKSVHGLMLAEPGGLTWDQTLEYFSKVFALNPLDETTNDFVFMDQILNGGDHNLLDYKLALSSVGNSTGDDQLSLPFWRYGAVCNAASMELAQSNPEDMNFTKNLSEYKQQVLFAYSELNPAYGSEHAEKLAASFDNASLIEIPNCGHEIIHFGWEEYYPIIKSYLEEIL